MINLKFHIVVWQAKLKRLGRFLKLYLGWCQEFDKQVQLILRQHKK